MPNYIIICSTILELLQADRYGEDNRTPAISMTSSIKTPSDYTRRHIPKCSNHQGSKIFSYFLQICFIAACHFSQLTTSHNSNELRYLS
jgi:hypothetical protein